MCGIAGGWTSSGISSRAVEKSLDAIRHRGPDDSGIFFEGPVFLGNRRLSIIDLEGGKQPISNEDGSVWVVFNGEIYNYLELIADLRSKGHAFRTRTDTEALVHLYEEYGTSLSQRLRGMFAFAIWDSRERLLYLSRDRFGKKPLYYTLSGEQLLFASELKALRPLAQEVGIQWTVRDQAIFDYLSLGFVPQPETLFEDVFSLGAGEWMVYDGAELKIEKYWSLQYVPKAAKGYKMVLEEARNLVAESVRLRLRSDVPLGVFLSGGIDSSVIAYEASRALGGSLNAFTVKMPDELLDESDVAARTAKHLNIRHTVLSLELDPLSDIQEVVRVYDQPFADPSAIPSLRVSRLAAEHVKVILNGDGGDEVFAGYRRYLAARYGSMLAWLPAAALAGLGSLLQGRASNRRSIMGFIARTLRGLACERAEQYLNWTLDMLRQTDKDKLWLRPAMRQTEEWIDSVLPEGLSPLDTLLCGDVRIILLGDLLVKMDMATMAASIEARSPLMDHELAQFAAGLPDSYKISNGVTKSVLRDAYADILPREVIRGGKRGFEPPLTKWLRSELRPLLIDSLGSNSAEVRSYIDGSFIDSLLQGKTFMHGNTSTLLYALLVLELWMRSFKTAYKSA
ncbi:MAG: asparagine synthase (glutamine-hydrolyzing) [Desulfomonile tiedjei]|uniref:asparagine synthase (glutamine-hydrolyzing) n=1 Tax=Desulfomonile tiedjei TaxID=2358 RepID=A0A9D6V3M5_9BACT|nr:asparagine synthase (glutamine-hydrolyzing) [Desulfomonile tiedjei]